MKQSQARIQELQKKLQAIAITQPMSPDSGSPSEMVELRPSSVAVDDVSAMAIDPVAASVNPSMPLDDDTDPDLNPFDVLLSDADLITQAQRLDQRSTQLVQQWQPPQAPPEHPTPPEPRLPMHSPLQARRQAEQQLTDWMQRLAAQIDQINRLSVAQETALLELKALSDRAEPDLKRIRSNPDLMAQINCPIPSLHLGVATVPHLCQEAQGQWVLMARPVELIHLGRTERRQGRLGIERSPHPIARPRSRKRSRAQPWMRHIINQIWELSQSWRLESFCQPKTVLSSTPEALSLHEGLVWFVGAIASRILLNLLLNAVPILWFPVMLLLLVPAVVVLYAAIRSPQSGVLWGYRLFLVMLGLLIGGRLV